jgi:hypothetical protein
LKALLRNIKSNSLKISLLLLSLNSVKNTFGATETDSLFKSEDIIQLELRSDFSAIQADRVSENPIYHDGELIYHSPDGKAWKFIVKIMIRGHFRRDTANCNFPPLFVNFRKNEVKNTIFENQDKLKLVTPCQYEKDIFDEYLVYKMYNKVTDISVKVKLAKILYFDTSTGKKVFEKYSFFTEDKNRVAERNNAFVKEVLVRAADLNRENFKKMSVFEYMIGNTDWYFTLGHNIIILQPNDTALAPYAVPYDFDLSGFVDARYADPKPGSEMAPNKQRIYKGLCYSSGEFDEIFKFFRDLKPEFESEINNLNLLSKSSKKQLNKYLDYFYSVIDNNKLVRREFLDACEKSVDYRIAY